MASVSDGKTFTIFKFKSSGLVALCQEVSDFVERGEHVRYNLDLDSARYNRYDGNHNIVFDYKEN